MSLQQRFLNNKFTFNQTNNAQTWYIRPLTAETQDSNQEIETVELKMPDKRQFQFFPPTYEKNNTESHFYRASLGLPVFNPSNTQYNNPPQIAEGEDPVISMQFKPKPVPNIPYSTT